MCPLTPDRSNPSTLPRSPGRGETVLLCEVARSLPGLLHSRCSSKGGDPDIQRETILSPVTVFFSKSEKTLNELKST